MFMIKEYKLKNDYISKFNELKKLNIKYSSLYLYVIHLDDVKYLKNFQINFSELKRLDFEQTHIEVWEFGYPEIYQKYKIEDNNNHINTFNKIMIPLIQNINNLVYLSIKFGINTIIVPNSFEFINNFKFLEYLGLEYINFTSIFVLKLFTLKSLELKSCNNIDFDKDLLKLKSLSLIETDIKKIMKLPELEEICIRWTNYKIIDFKILHKLKIFDGSEEDTFLLLTSPVLEEAYFNFFDKVEKFNQIIEKICSFKYLKKLDLTTDILNDEILSTIQCKNESVTELHLQIYGKSIDIIINNFQNIFPNLTDIFIHISSLQYKGNVIINIEENINSKVKNINVRIEGISLKMYCQSYDKLESIDLNIFNQVLNIYPILSEDNNKIFKSLKKLTFNIYSPLNINIVDKIYKNIDKMPNLVYFSLFYKNDKYFNEKLYKNLINKILSMKYIKKINIDLNKESSDNYSKKELKKIFPNINFDNIYEINISKPNNNYSCTIY